MPSISRRPVLALGAFLVLAGLIFFFYPKRSSFPPLPQPNGYDVFVRAAAKVIHSEKALKEMSANELAEFVGANEAALKELRTGLALPSIVPVWTTEDWIQTQVTNGMNLRAADRAMAAEGLLLQQRGNVTGALDKFLDGLRFGDGIARGGVLINFLIGSACEVGAARHITNLLAGLSAPDCKRAALVLHQHEARRETLEAIMKREQEWSARTFGFFARIRQMIEARSLHPGEEWNFLVPDTTKEYRTRTLEVRTLMLRLAARAYEMDRGRKPRSASELVPDYLPDVPVDPVSKARLELP